MSLDKKGTVISIKTTKEETDYNNLCCLCPGTTALQKARFRKILLLHPPGCTLSWSWHISTRNYHETDIQLTASHESCWSAGIGAQPCYNQQLQGILMVPNACIGQAWNNEIRHPRKGIRSNIWGHFQINNIFSFNLRNTDSSVSERGSYLRTGLVLDRSAIAYILWNIWSQKIDFKNSDSGKQESCIVPFEIMKNHERQINASHLCAQIRFHMHIKTYIFSYPLILPYRVGTNIYLCQSFSS